MTLLHKSLLAGCIAAAFIPAAHAEKFFGSSSVSLLYSEDYEIFGTRQETATVFTFENATAHNWGDTFFFVDRYQVHGSSDSADNWGAPFEVGQARFLFDGYIDYASGVSGGQSADLHINPQFKLDLGHFAGETGVLYAGIEYSYWRNKYGSPAIDTENAISALVKFHF